MIPPCRWDRWRSLRWSVCGSPSPRTRLEDIPGGVRTALAGAALPIKRGDTVAVGAGSRGIANIAVIVRATVD